MDRRKILFSLLFTGILITGIQTVEAAGLKYLGFKGCRGCHKKQYDSWKDTSMARTFDALVANVNVDMKTDVEGLDPMKDYTTTPKCLRCHATGFGEPGGFKDMRSDRNGLAGVSCEACHGPGERYFLVMGKKRKTYRVIDLIVAGYERPNQATCNKCHVPGCPAADDDHEMDFDDSAGHDRFPLKYDH